MDHRRMPHTPRHRQGGQGRPGRQDPAAAGRHRAEGDRRAHQLDTSTVDDIIWGTSNQSNTQGSDLGRMAALDAGYDVRASGVTLDRILQRSVDQWNVNILQKSVDQWKVNAQGTTQHLFLFKRK